MSEGRDRTWLGMEFPLSVGDHAVLWLTVSLPGFSDHPKTAGPVRAVQGCDSIVETRPAGNTPPSRPRAPRRIDKLSAEWEARVH